MDLQKQLKAQEISALGAGLEAVLRRFIRPLIGSMSLERLEELLRLVFVEEAERHLRREYPGRSAPVSQLALLTGLDTRQLNKLRSRPGFGERGKRISGFASNITPTTHLLDLWSTNPDYADLDSGQPRPLAITSLEALMRSSTFIRGVTPRSVADRLVLSGAATEDDDGRLHMVTEKFLPSASGDVEGAIEVGFHAIGRLVDTVFTNLERLGTDEPRLYQRAYWTNRLAPHRQAEFRARLGELMAEFEDRGTTVLTEMEMKIEAPSQVTGGFGLYYFEDPSPD
ncbi:MAG: DUF6502 family protein [Gammaproteobacteria bacterium]